MLGFWLQSLTTHAPFTQPIPARHSVWEAHPRFWTGGGASSVPVGAELLPPDEQQQAPTERAMPKVAT